jgi:hypothetical protein
MEKRISPISRDEYWLTFFGKGETMIAARYFQTLSKFRRALGEKHPKKSAIF